MLGGTTKISSFQPFRANLTLLWPWDGLTMTLGYLFYETQHQPTLRTRVVFRPIYRKFWSNNLFSPILNWFDLAVTLRWPWGKNPVKYNPNLVHHVYLGWALPDVINVLVIGQNIASVCYFVHCAMWDSIDTRVIWRGGGGVKNPPTLNVISATSRGCFCVGPCWDLDMFQDIVYISSEHNVSKNNKNNLFSTILSRFDLVVTLRWPHHDLWITSLWNPTPTHVTMCTWVGFRSIYWKCWSNNPFKRNIFEQNSFPLTVFV